MTKPSWEKKFDKNFSLKEFIDTGAWYACKEFIRQTIKEEREQAVKEYEIELMKTHISKKEFYIRGLSREAIRWAFKKS